MTFNYFHNKSYVGILKVSKGVSSLDSSRLSGGPIGGALFRNTVVNANYTHTWTVPEEVVSVSVVCIGGGGGGMFWSGSSSTVTYAMSGGAGGALAWLNNITVTPGESISIQVGGGGRDGYYSNDSQSGGASFFKNASTINANGGAAGRYNLDLSGATYTVSTSYGTYGGGNGGGVNCTSASGYGPAGGGGAGGYSGNGGDGRDDAAASGDDGSGGGGAGGGASSNISYEDHISGGGGGVAPYGEGSSGTGNTNGSAGGGSGGDDSSIPTNINGTQAGGNYGGGGGGKSSQWWGYHAGNGGQGVVRVIWGPFRTFPSTNVGQNYLGFTETTYTN